MLHGCLDRTLPRFASDDPALVNRSDATRYAVKRADVYLNLTLVAAEEARSAERAEASSRYVVTTPVYSNCSGRQSVGQKGQTGHLSAIRAVT